MSNSDVRSADPKQVVFIDSRAPDIQALIAGVTPGELVFVLDASSDGIQQIADILAANNLTGLSAISIVGHGTAGAIDLGSTVLNEQNLAGHATALATIGAALTADGDLALYACNTAAGAAGQQFIADLSTYTGADVAAATHVVGDAAHGGSWTLDATTGSIEASTPFTAATLETFEGTLAPVNGQLWYGTFNDFDVNHNSPFGYFTMSGTNQSTAGSSAHTTSGNSYIGDIALDTAAGWYFAINKDTADDFTSIVSGSTSTGTQVSNLLLNPNGGTSDYRIFALAVDPKNDVIYIGIWGKTTDSGIIRVSYNQLTGVINGGSSLIVGSGASATIDPSLYIVKAGTNFTNPVDFALDVANQKLYFAATDFNGSGGYYGNGFGDTNGIYVIDLPSTSLPPPGSTAAPTLLSDAFPGDNDNGMAALALNAADNIIYFATADGRSNNGLIDSNIYALNITTHVVTPMSLPSGITLQSVARGGLAYDPVSNQLIVSDSGDANNGAIYTLLLNAAGTAFTSGAVLDANVDNGVPIASTTGIAFNALASIGALSGSSTQALQGGNGITLLGAAPTNVTDSDGGGNLASATVKISNGQAGDLIGIDANFTLTTTPASVVIGGLTFFVSYNAATYTLTITNPSGVLHTYDEFETALAHVAFKDTGTDASTGAHPTRTVVWQVNDGANGDPTGSPGTNNTTTTITINRGPVGGADVNTAIAGGSVQIPSNVLTNDTDLDGDAASHTVSGFTGFNGAGTLGSSYNGHYGTFVLNANGSWSYTADKAAALSAAPAGVRPVETFTYTVSDGDGGTATTTLTITVDRAPTAGVDNNTAVAAGSAATGNVLTNDTDLDGDGLTVFNVNASQANVGQTIATTYGHITLNSNGTYTYTADNAAAINAGATGSHLVDQISYTNSDGSTGAGTTLSITIDRAPSPVANTNSALSGGASVNGNVLTNDSDRDGDTLTVSAVTGGALGAVIVGTYGNYQIDGAGNYTYTAGVTAGQRSAIAGAGGNPTEHIAFTVSDGHGGFTTSALDVDVESAPLVTSITAAGTGIDGGGNGDINAGHVVTLTLHMSSAVTVSGGVPTLILNSHGGGTAFATYLSGSGSSDLVFTYTVADGENAADLAVTSLSTNGATIQDGAAQNADFTIVPAVTGTLQIDTAHPTVSIVADDTSLVAGQTATVTFTFSEAVSSFALGDVATTGGVLSNLVHVGIDGSSHDIYTATFTPSVTDTEVGSVQVTASSYNDGAGNAGGGSNTVNFTGDTQAPTVSVVADDTTLLAGQTATLTFTFSEAVSNFVIGDVTVTGGGLSNLVHVGVDGSGHDIYTATFTPSATNTEAGSAQVAVGSYADGAGNIGSASNTVNFTGDTLAPTVSVSADDTSLVAGQTATVTFTFSEAVSNFDLSGTTATGGALGNLIHVGIDGSGHDIYTATFTPDVTNTEVGSVQVTASSYTDGAGNAGGGGTVNFTGDTQAPTVSIAADQTTLLAGQTATLTFTFSEAVSSFVIGDVTVSGGGLSNLVHVGVDGSGHDIYTATFTPSASNTEVGSAQVTAASYADGVGNTGSASNTINFSGDTLAPTVTISADDTTLIVGQTATVTFTFSEAVSNFDLTDTAVTGGALSSLIHVGVDGSGHDIYTATFTPDVTNTENGTAQVTVSSYTDAAGNTGAVSNTLNFTGDTEGPTVAISADDTSLLAGQTATVTFTFSEAVSNFDLTDTTVTGGALSNLIHVGVDGSGHDIYTATFTPTVGGTTGSVQVADASYSDGTGNTGTASNTVNFSNDTVPPTVSIAADDTSLVAGQTATVTFTFSEAVSSFDLSDTTVTGGALGNLIHVGIDGSGHDIYTATFTPSATNTEAGSVQVNASSYADTAGNAGAASNTVNFTGDTLAPTVAIAADDTSLVAGQAATVTFTFSEAVSNFALGDVTVTGGALGNLIHVGIDGSGHDIYTATFTPGVSNTANGSAQVTVSSYTDASGNTGAASNTITFTGDTLVPTVSSVATSGAGITAGSGTLNTGDVVTFTVNASESVFVSGGVPTLILNDGGVATYTGGSGSSALTFSYTVLAGQNTSDLTVTGASLNGGTIRDGAGNDANLGAATTNPAGTLTIDTTAPTVSVSSNLTNLHAGETATVTFTFSEAVQDFTLSDVLATGGSLSGLTQVGTTNVYTAIFTPVATNLEVGQVQVNGSSYTDVAGNAGGPSNTINYSGDTLRPHGTAAANPGSGVLMYGNTVHITLSFTEAVVINGVPVLTLNDGGTATYNLAATQALGDSTKMVFDYTVGANDSSVSTLAITGVSGGSINDHAGNASDSLATSFNGLSVQTSVITANPDSNHGKVGTPITADASHGVLSNDTDTNPNDHLVVSAVNGSAGGVDHVVNGTYGSLTLHADGSYSYSASSSSNDYLLVDSFSYTANNGHGQSSTSTLNISVVGGNFQYVPVSAGGTASTGYGNTVLDGSAGNATLTAMNTGARQVLIGGPNDVLNAATYGVDVFVFNGNFGHNTINNFSANDIIQLQQSQFGSLANVMGDLHQVGANAVLTLDPDHVVTITNMQVASLTAGNFHLV